MMIQLGCASPPSVDRFAPGIIGFLDCQAQTLGAQGYQALAAPGSTASLFTAAMLTLLVAFIGYRMLLGETPTVREGVLTLAKIGIVLTLTTSWPAYQKVIYDVTLRTPASIAAEIAPASLPGARGGLVEHLDYVDGELAALAVSRVGQLRNEVNPREVMPPPFIGFDNFALGTSRVIFLAAAIGAFAMLRLAAGLLLAMGPLFIAFLLFEGTRGLFEGWLRGLIAIILGSVGTAIVLSVELALLEPWLSSLLARRAGSLAIAGVPAQLLATTFIFGSILGAMLIFMGRIAFSWRFPHFATRLAPAHSASAISQSTIERSNAASPSQGRSRAASVAEAVAATQRRETPLGGSANDGMRRISPSMMRSRDPQAPTAGPVRLGQSFPRRVGTRVSARAGRRDSI